VQKSRIGFTDEFAMLVATARHSFQRGFACMSTQALRMTAAIGCSLVIACSTTVERVSDPGQLKSLGFLQTSPVSRQEVEGRLGSPASEYEEGRIVVYVLRKQGDQFQVSSDALAQYRLVVVYRSDATIDRWSLVNVAR
jgi:hypothetical protein